FPSGHMGVDIIPIVDAVECKVRESPLTRIEAVSLINEADVVFSVVRVSPENRLAAIGVAEPLVQRKNSRKCLWISHSLKHPFRQVVEDLPLKWITDVACPELQPRLTQNGVSRALHAQLGSVSHQPIAYKNDLCVRDRQPNFFGQTACQIFIGQDFQVLGIVLKFDYVILLIPTAHQVRLRAATHSSYVL